VAWEKCEDGELDFRVSHKGVKLEEAVHRLRVDGAEILENALDQKKAVDEVNSLLNGQEKAPGI
jgi:hypothetical protein